MSLGACVKIEKIKHGGHGATEKFIDYKQNKKLRDLRVSVFELF